DVARRIEREDSVRLVRVVPSPVRLRLLGCALGPVALGVVTAPLCLLVLPLSRALCVLAPSRCLLALALTPLFVLVVAVGPVGSETLPHAAGAPAPPVPLTH